MSLGSRLWPVFLILTVLYKRDWMTQLRQWPHCSTKLNNDQPAWFLGWIKDGMTNNLSWRECMLWYYTIHNVMYCTELWVMTLSPHPPFSFDLRRPLSLRTSGTTRTWLAMLSSLDQALIKQHLDVYCWCIIRIFMSCVLLTIIILLLLICWQWYKSKLIEFILWFL